MTSIQNEQHPLVDIAAPVVAEPKSSTITRSPLVVKINRGTGGHYAAKEFQVDFHPNGPMGIKKSADSGHFDQALPPGPYELHAVAKWYDGSDSENSGWTFVKDIYILTPPQNGH